MTADASKTDGETDSSSSDKQSPVSVEMMEDQAQLPAFNPGSFMSGRSATSFKDTRQEEREVSPLDPRLSKEMTPEIYLALLAQEQRKRKFSSGEDIDGLISPTIRSSSSKNAFGDNAPNFADFPFSGSLFDDADSEYWLQLQMALRRQGSPPDILDDPPVLRRSNSHDARSPSPQSRGDFTDSQDRVLYHHGSRVIPRRRNNPIWDQAVGRSGHGLVRMSHSLRDDMLYDGLSFPQERCAERERPRHQGFTRSRSPDWMSYLGQDFDPSLLTDLPPTSSASYLWGDSSDLDSLSIQQEEMIDVLRRRRSGSRRVRPDPDQEDYFQQSRLPSSSGHLTSPHAEPPPLLSEYYQRSLAFSEQGVPDSEVWSAAIEKQRREQSKYGFSNGHGQGQGQGRPRYPGYEPTGLWDTPLPSEPTDEVWDTRLSSIWSRDPTELAPQRPVSLRDRGVIGEDKEMKRGELSRDSSSSSSDLEFPTAPLNVESEKVSPQDSLPPPAAYDPFLSDIWGSSMARSWMPKESGQ